MIIDCFPFFNELDLLEVRLNELDDIVDFFVISEANLTFTAKPKPLYYNENKKRFAKFSHKILHTVVDDYPVKTLSNTWAMDYFQKQQGVNYLQNELKPASGDVIIFSDADEIPKASAIKKAVLKNNWQRLALQMPLYYYYLNCLCTTVKWRFAQVVRFNGPVKLSSIRGKRSADSKITNAGWHFSYLGDIQYKLDSFAHTEFNRPPYNNKNNIKSCRQSGKDLFNRNNKYRFKFVSDLGYLPEYIRSNLNYFEKYIKRDGEND